MKVSYENNVLYHSLLCIMLNNPIILFNLKYNYELGIIFPIYEIES